METYNKKYKNSLPLILKDQWIAKQYNSSKKYKSNEPEYEKLALASRKVTNVFSFMPKELKKGLLLNPFSPGQMVKAAVYSASFMVQLTIAQRLDIDPEELEICRIQGTQAPDTPDLMGRVIISDSLPNGSGFSKWAYDNWDELMSIILRTTPEDNYMGGIISQQHIHGDGLLPPCRSACYQCLLSFRNMSYHGLLDWRLGISYLRIIHDPNYYCGIDGNFDYPELQDWKDMADKEAKKFADAFNYKYQEDKDWKLPCLTKSIGNKTYAIIVHHPLWDVKNRTDILAKTYALAVSFGYTPLFIDTFNLMRRPSWCYSKINKDSNETS